MITKRQNISLCLIGIFMIFPILGLAQNTEIDSVRSELGPDSSEVIEETVQKIFNVDSLFNIAKSTAFETKDYQTAIGLCEKILNQDPENYDAKIFLGRLCAWSGQYVRSISVLRAVVDGQRHFDDARNALIDALMWDKQFSEALEIIDAGIGLDPLTPQFYYQKALCLQALDDPGKAQRALHHLLKLDPEHKQGQVLLKQLIGEKAIRSFTHAYSYQRLADTRTQWQALVVTPSLDPWQLLTLELKQHLQFGPLIARYTRANRFQETGQQVELEAYPNIRKGTYAYVGLAYSGTQLFPISRIGLELFQDLPRSFECSIGSRLLHLDLEDIVLYTISAGKYWGNYWFSLRSFITPESDATALAWNFQSRRYLSDADSYIQVSLSQGQSPDLSPVVEELKYLNSWRFAVQLQQKLNDTNVLNLGLELANMEIRDQAYRGETGAFLAYTRRF